MPETQKPTHYLKSESSGLSPVVAPPNWGQVNDEEFTQWIDRVVGADSYGATRVFDLFTMLAITLAFALMFAFVKIVLDDRGEYTLWLSLFVTGLAIFQLTLWGGNKPRLASLVGGPFVLLAVNVLILVLQMNLQRLAQPEFWITSVCSLLFLGIPAGYLGGAMVAGVFLLADLFREKYLSGDRGPEAENDDAIFAIAEDNDSVTATTDELLSQRGNASHDGQG